MALVTGPLLSLDARGQVAGSIVFSNWKGRAYVRQLVTPSNPKSAGQTSNRAMFKFLSQAWAGLSAAEQATWEALAAATTISPFNAYQSFNMAEWTQFVTPFKDPAASGETIPVMGALTLTGGVRQAEISQVITTANDIWGMLIARSDATFGGDPTKTQIVAAVEYPGASPITYVDTPLAPDTYFYRTAGFTGDGQLTAWVTEGSVVVT